ncbi:MAG: N-acetylmuramoyl-L-alanine amidase [Deltaproteobacteria bacterium]|nr:N-acetylmuramoyl-L-alanine amidase [Deltaproteobacteria bacterium]MBW2394246.1 N-acetylmuramoyl-L-alanine amidase [Deltaproteobacteria bacterium]
MSRAVAISWLGLFAIVLLGAERPPGLADVRDVRHWSYKNYTRVVVELSGPTGRSEVKRLAADRKAGRPERIYLDLPNVWVGTRYADPIRVGDGLLRGIRLGQNRATASRLVIDLERYERHRLFQLTSPDRLVLDIYAHRGPHGGTITARHPSAQKAPRGAPPALKAAPSPRTSLRPVHTVVIDPGHGGDDPGAVGVGGVREKDVTLRLARELALRLRERGFQVFLTRERDQKVSLEARTAFAEGKGADVFVSIHANAARRRGAHGIETYFLDKGHERHSLRVAARENGVPPNELDALQRAVAGLKVSEMSIQSRSLARAVHGKMVKGVRKTHGSVKDLGVKQAPFHVLFLSGMPSILIETGFVTHPQEAKRLASRFYRAVLAEQIARGLSSYRSERSAKLARHAS